ncbi:MAG: hypothetical protein KGN36_15470 [Acidobacteriota bacterium]|nr:hypothetical protein [Acidobacteriota bacterium]
MKSFLAACGVAALLWVAPVSAQTSVSRYNVPFPFVVGNEIIPAGHYRVTVDTNFYLCRLQAVDSTATHVVRLVPGVYARGTANRMNAGVLRFAKLDGQYYLTGIWKAGEVSGHETLSGRRFNQLAKGGTGSETVSLDSDAK